MKKRIFVYLFVSFCMFIWIFNALADSYSGSGKHFARDRSLMLAGLVNYRGITDNKVLKAIKKVKRHKFLPEKFQKRAYIDEKIGLSIGYGQTISPIHAVALMTQELELKGDERVLEIGTGSGYQAAVLAEIVEDVYTIEIIQELANSAKTLLKQLGYKNIKVKCGDGFLGWKKYAPYDAILVTAAVDEVPQPLIDQLTEGGRMIIPVNKKDGQEYKLIRKINAQITQEKVDVTCDGPDFVPMTGEHTGIAVPAKK